MSAVGKYRIIEANDLEGIKRYRAVIEYTLKTAELSPAHRIELELALRRAWTKQVAAQKIEDQRIEEEEEKKKKKGEGEGSTEGSGGDQQGSGSSSGDSRGGGALGDGDKGDEGDALDHELVALLLYMAEMDIAQPMQPHVETPDCIPAFAAATLMLDREEGVAQVHESYSLRNESTAQPRSNLLPALELHAAAIGVRVMQLKVHPDIVPLFQSKLGYVPYGNVLTRKGGPVQKMRKVLAPAPRLATDVPV